MTLDTFRCTAKDLIDHYHENLTTWLRIEGDADDPNTWHPIRGIRDPFGDIDRTVTVTFTDGTPEKMFNDTDVVEFAVPRPF